MRKLFMIAVRMIALFFCLGAGTLHAKGAFNTSTDLTIPAMTVNSPVPQDKDMGIGPVKSVELGPLNSKMISEGKTIYTNQCIICHDNDQNKLGPSLKNVTKTRTPEYIMNLLLNTAQMQKDNVTIKALLKQYNNLPMPDPALNQSKARSVLEYLRSLAK